MIPRSAHSTVERLARGFPIVALTGPRQAGKTTLAKACFPDKPYVSLENPDEREFAESDPKRFLARFAEGAILDEVQHCPELFSWLQGLVDERQRMGDFVLTGSQQFGLLSGVSQSLAGRVGRVELLPLSSSEMQLAKLFPSQLEHAMFTGAYPALYDRDLLPSDWYANYVATYIERDVRQVINVQDLSQFQRFVRMCAARSGQLLNLTSLGNDCGIAASTARQWLSILEASYLVILLKPHHRNFGKRLVKTPKLYFLDTGLACWLLGIKSPSALDIHASRGALFETWVVSELIKQSYNVGQPSPLHFWRDNVGHEVDLVFESGIALQAVEIKSGSTFAKDWPKNVQWWQAQAGGDTLPPFIIYGGDDSQARKGFELLSWRDIAKVQTN